MNEEKPFFDEKTFALQAQVLNDYRQLKKSFKALEEHMEINTLNARHALTLFSAAMFYISEEIVKKTRAKNSVDDLLKGLRENPDEPENQG